MEENQQNTLRKWRARYKRAQIAHNATAITYRWYHISLGVLLITFTTISGIVTFWKPPVEWELAPIMVAIAAALLAAFQTFMQFSEQAEIHRAAARRYGEIKKEIEFILTFGSAIPDIAKRIDEVRAKEVAIGQDAPNAMPRHWNRASNVTAEENERHSIRNQT